MSAFSARGKGKHVGQCRSRSKRAGTIFPVGRLSRHLKAASPHLRLGAAAPVYLAAVLEYLSAEVLEQAGKSAFDHQRKRIGPRDIRLAICNDLELDKLCQDVLFTEGGGTVDIRLDLEPPTSKPVKKKKKRPSHGKVKVLKVSKPKVKATKASKTSVKPHPSAGSAATATSGTTAAGDGAAVPAAAVPSLPVLSEGTLFLGQKLLVVMGDIRVVTADAIVHPTNESYSTAGQVGRVLQAAGSLEYQAALDSIKSLGNMDKCGVSICDMFHIEAKKVIHCNCPSWSMSQDVLDLQKTIDNCFKLADKEHLRSIALPSVGSGNAGWPKQLAAETILRAINRYFQTIMASSIKTVYFVLYDKESVDIYTSELKKLLESSM